MRNTDSVDSEVIKPECLSYSTVAITVVAVRVAFAMPLRKIDRSFFAFPCLDQSVGEFLLAVGDDTLDPPFIVKNDGAVRLDFILTCTDWISIDVDVFNGDLR